MFLSKIWFVLVGLAAGVATTAAFVAPRTADRRIIELEGQRLDRAQYAAEQMLKADAHSWIDYKDARYCEGCELALRARAQAYRPGQDELPKASDVMPPAAGR